MSTFLELAVLLRGECGISGTGPTTLVGQTGELLDVVNWISRAYEHVQNEHPNWEFLRTDFSFPTIATVRTYTLAAIGITDHGSWKVDDDDNWRVYLTSAGTIGEQWLVYRPWEEFRDMYLFGATRDQTGMPTDFTIMPDDSVQLWPTPNGIYTIAGERYKSPTEMAVTGAGVDTATPNFPKRFHKILMWQGLTYYGGKEESSSNFARGTDEAEKLMFDLELDQLPPPTIGGALA